MTSECICLKLAPSWLATLPDLFLILMTFTINGTLPCSSHCVIKIQKLQHNLNRLAIEFSGRTLLYCVCFQNCASLNQGGGYHVFLDLVSVDHTSVWSEIDLLTHFKVDWSCWRNIILSLSTMVLKMLIFMFYQINFSGLECYIGLVDMIFKLATSPSLVSVLFPRNFRFDDSGGGGFYQFMIFFCLYFANKVNQDLKYIKVCYKLIWFSLQVLVKGFT